MKISDFHLRASIPRRENTAVPGALQNALQVVIEPQNAGYFEVRLVYSISEHPLCRRGIICAQFLHETYRGLLVSLHHQYE